MTPSFLVALPCGQTLRLSGTGSPDGGVCAAADLDGRRQAVPFIEHVHHLQQRRLLPVRHGQPGATLGAGVLAAQGPPGRGFMGDAVEHVHLANPQRRDPYPEPAPAPSLQPVYRSSPPPPSEPCTTSIYELLYRWRMTTAPGSVEADSVLWQRQTTDHIPR